MGTKTRYTRQNLPPNFRDVLKWPQVDTQALDPEVSSRFSRRQRALHAYLENQQFKNIYADTRMSRSEVIRYLNRCVALHPDGRIFGWRGLLPWKHTSGYTRLAARRKSKGGNGGAFTQFLNEHPALAEALNEAILKRIPRDALPEAHFSHRETYGRFKRLCIEHGISTTQYPLSNADGGCNALRKYARGLLLQHFTVNAERLGGSDARIRSHLGRGIGERFPSAGPYDLVALDAHKLDFIACLGVRDGDRVRPVPIRRLTLIAVIELTSTAVLGYHVVIGRDPNAQDVVKAIKAALTRWTPRKLTLPGFRYPEAAKLPSAAIAGAEGLCWNAMLLDNAVIHYAHPVAVAVRMQLGCAINYGPAYQWYRRPLIESLFSSLECAGFSRLPNGTGFGPGDPRRPDGVANAVKYRMLVEEMVDLLDVLICSYNANPRRSLGHLSPLQVLADAMLCAPTHWLPRKLGQVPPCVPEMGVEVRDATVRGNPAKGHHPYIQYREVHYSNPVLAQSRNLIGERIRIHVDPDDLRSVKAFFDNGEEIGVLKATSGWSRTRHNAKLRREAMVAIDDGKLAVGPGEDVVQALLALKHWELQQELRDTKGKRPKISLGATTLARALQATGEALDLGAAPQAPRSKDSPARGIEISAPSFIPKLRHRGVQR
jgi:putative transposase